MVPNLARYSSGDWQSQGVMVYSLLESCDSATTGEGHHHSPFVMQLLVCWATYMHQVRARSGIWGNTAVHAWRSCVVISAVDI